jgi:fused signal recognition particle receptor
MFKILKEKLGTIKKKLAKEVEVESAEEAFGDKGKKISEDRFEDLIWDLEMALLEADVALPVVEEIKTHLKKELLEKRIKKGVDPEKAVELALKNAIKKTLSSEKIDFDEFIKNHEKPVVIMFVGVNGTGKTTAIARIAHRLIKQGYSVVLAAADTFRAGAIEQLTIHANNLGVKIVKHQSGSDPAAVAYDAIEHAKARHKDVVLIDTAGRMQTNTNLMDEMKKIKRVANPDMIVFVGDSLAGNDAIEQARKFDEAVGIDAAILTKIDADAKGGAALSIAHAVGKPIIFIGTGQEYEDLIPFDEDWMIKKLFEG